MSINKTTSTIFSSNIAENIPPEDLRTSLLIEKRIIKMNIQIIMDNSRLLKMSVRVSIFKIFYRLSVLKFSINFID